MANRKRKKGPDREFSLAADLTPSQVFAVGLGVVIFGMATMRYAPRVAHKVVPMIPDFLEMLFRPLLAPIHPEAAEPVETMIDERQMGRSEVIRQIAKGEAN